MFAVNKLLIVVDPEILNVDNNDVEPMIIESPEKFGFTNIGVVFVVLIVEPNVNDPQINKLFVFNELKKFPELIVNGPTTFNVPFILVCPETNNELPNVVLPDTNNEDVILIDPNVPVPETNNDELNDDSKFINVVGICNELNIAGPEL